MTNRQVSLAAWWDQPYMHTLRDGAALHVIEFNGPLLLPSEVGRMYMIEAKRLKEAIYKPDLSRSRKLGWSFQKADEFISTSKLCEEIVLRLLELVKRRRTGELQPIDY